jgi:signal transduction histidine kinase
VYSGDHAYLMSRPSHLRSGPAGAVAVSAAALVMCALTAATTISGSTSDYAELEAFARVLIVGVPIGVGLFALHRQPFERFGALLVGSGPLLFLATLANSEDATLYSAGRVAGWAVEPYLVYLMLAFPSGRLAGRIDHALFYAITLLALILFLPTALVVERFPVPAPWMTCDADCPRNAFMLTSSEPGLIEDVVRPLREFVLVAIAVAVAARIAHRIWGAKPLTRRTLAPVLGVACFRIGAFGLVLLGRRVAPESDLVEVSVWLLAIVVPLMAIAFLVGLARWWVFIARATQRLAARLRGHPSPDDLRAALAEAFDDPSLEIVYWMGNGDGYWGDAEGHPIEHPLTGPGRSLTEIDDRPDRIAGIVHDSALRDDRAFIDAATSYALMTLDNHRLSAQTSSLVREVRDSRARIQAAADAERRRIERDLHDGAQQRLVALRIKLELAAERTGGGEGEGAAVLRGLGGEVEEALEEVRSLARGIYPPSLADRGLVEGLRAAALRNPLPTTVLAAGIRRYSREVESAAYFVCLEALQNVAKHAQGASGAVIELSDNGSLRAEVRDDGAGFDSTTIAGGVGFTSMRDRLAAVGGELAIVSRPGRGTRVAARIPLGDDAPEPVRSRGSASPSLRAPLG